MSAYIEYYISIICFLFNPFIFKHKVSPSRKSENIVTEFQQYILKFLGIYSGSETRRNATCARPMRLVYVSVLYLKRRGPV